MSKKIILSSSMKFRDLIGETMKKLNAIGFEGVFPNLDSSQENTDTALTIEQKNALAWDHYRAIDEADAIYFILPRGYMGTSCKLELGYALARNKPIYFSEPTGDIALDGYVKKIIPLESLGELKEELVLL